MPASTETFFNTAQSRAGRRGWLGLAMVVLLVGLIAMADKVDAAPAPAAALNPAAEQSVAARSPSFRVSL